MIVLSCSDTVAFRDIEDPGDMSHSIYDSVKVGNSGVYNLPVYPATGEIVWLIKKNRQQEHAR